MNEKVVLVVDDDSRRAENLVFIVQLGGYVVRSFGNEEAALNWAKYGCSEGDVLCLLFNNPGKFDRAEEIAAAWSASGGTLPVVLVQRGKESWNRLLAIGDKDHFFVCEPESVMQTLDILTTISTKSGFDLIESSEIRMNTIGGRVQCK